MIFHANEFSAEYEDGNITADQYNFITHKICEVVGLSKGARPLIRRALASYGEDMVTMLMGHALLYYCDDCLGLNFMSDIEGLLGIEE